MIGTGVAGLVAAQAGIADELRAVQVAVRTGESGTAGSWLLADRLGRLTRTLRRLAEAEDELLWTAVLGRRRDAARAVLRAEEQHRRLGDLLDHAIGQACRGERAALDQTLDELRTVLADHLAGEQRDLVPLLADVSAAEWQEFQLASAAG